MADDNKTEKPTPKKLRDARKEGQVGVSRDLSICASISSMVALVYFLRGSLGMQLQKQFNAIFGLINTKQLDLTSLLSIVTGYLNSTLGFVFICVGSSAAFTVAVTVTQQGGLLITNKLLKFDLQKFNIVNNLKQIFSKKNFTKFFFNCIKVSIMTYIAFRIFRSDFNDVLLLREISLLAAIGFINHVIIKIVVVLLVIFFLFAILDLVMEKQATLKQLMMNLEEIKREYKESEGDPEVKAQRKELHRELLEEEPADFDPNTFVVVNPTHIAIVLIYKPLKWKLPLVLAKEKGENAQAIISYARKRKIAVIQDKWLARQLYAIAQLNEFVPRTLLTVVAELVVKNIDQLPQIAADLAEQAKPAPPAPNVPIPAVVAETKAKKPFGTVPLRK
jgi:type III secretion protein U